VEVLDQRRVEVAAVSPRWGRVERLARGRGGSASPPGEPWPTGVEREREDADGVLKADRPGELEQVGAAALGSGALIGTSCVEGPW
jgi:hypothetical protein